MLAVIAVFLACFFDWRVDLAPGEVGTIMIIACDRRQARVIMRYCLGLMQAVPMLKRQIEGVTQESITLRNRVVIEIHTASFRTTRGYSICAALLDELAYFPNDEHAAEPDVEVINAIKPGMARSEFYAALRLQPTFATRSALGSLPEALWPGGRPNSGVAGLLRDMNPSLPQEFIDQHMAEDPARAAAEYLAQFRTDVEAFVLREAVEGCIARGVYERGPLSEHRYVGFVDPSGGSVDLMTLGVAHRERDKTASCLMLCARSGRRSVRRPSSETFHKF